MLFISSLLSQRVRRRGVNAVVRNVAYVRTSVRTSSWVVGGVEAGGRLMGREGRGGGC